MAILSCAQRFGREFAHHAMKQTAPGAPLKRMIDNGALVSCISSSTHTTEGKALLVTIEIPSQTDLLRNLMERVDRLEKEVNTLKAEVSEKKKAAEEEQPRLSTGELWEKFCSEYGIPPLDPNEFLIRI